MKVLIKISLNLYLSCYSHPFVRLIGKVIQRSLRFYVDIEVEGSAKCFHDPSIGANRMSFLVEDYVSIVISEDERIGARTFNTQCFALKRMWTFFESFQKLLPVVFWETDLLFLSVKYFSFEIFEFLQKISTIKRFWYSET